jgi:hypothetical protein
MIRTHAPRLGGSKFLATGLLLFSNLAADRDEGKTFVSQKRVTTNRRSKVSFTFVTDSIVTGMITATATGPGGNTSEFSDPLGVATE